MNHQKLSKQQSAAERWAATVQAEHEQADRVRSDDPNADHWKSLAHRFAPATRETAFQDDTFIAVSRFVQPGDTVIDVGAGAGRIAVPLADRCKHVTAVEPSEAMRERLREQADAWNLENLSIVGESWEDAEVEQADIVVCAHVVYTVRQIEPFLTKLTDRSRRAVIIIVFEEPAMANYFELWRLVHGERRIALPALNELKAVLQEMNITFDAVPLEAWQSRPFLDRDSAYEESLARLFITPQTENRELTNRLRTVLSESLVQADDGFRFKWARPHRPWLVTWSAQTTLPKA